MAVTPTVSSGGAPPQVATVFGTSRGTGLFLWLLLSGGNLVLLLLDPVDGIPRPGAWVAWAALTVAAAGVFFPRGDPLGAWWTGVAATLSVVAAAAVVWDPPSEASGYAPWYLRSATIVLVVVVLRRRAAAAGIATIAVCVTVLTWAVASGQDVGHWIGVLAGQTALVVIVVTAIGLRWADRTIAAYRAEERERVRSEETRAASIRERRAELTTVRALSAPVLERIARGDGGARVRAEATRVEAALRDLLRGRRLSAEPLSTAVHDARGRGLEVTLLDDFSATDLGYVDESASELDRDQRRELLAWAAERVRAAAGATLTVRLSQAGDRPLVTILTSEVDIVARAF